MREPARDVACAVCGIPVDPLRAARVRFTSSSRFYFCSEEHALSFQILPAEPSPEEQSAPHPETRAPEVAPQGALPQRRSSFPPSPFSDDRISANSPPLPEYQSRRYSALPPVRVIVPAPPSLPVAVTLTLLPVLLCLTGAALLGATGHDPWSSAASAVVLGVTSYFSTRFAFTKLAETDAISATSYLSSLSEWARRLTDDEPVLLAQEELRPGEEVLVLGGEHVPADGTVAEGHAEALPWPSASHQVTLEAGSRVCAGARLLSGSVRIICAKTGSERAYAALLPEALTRTAAHVAPAFWARLTSDFLGPGLGLCLGALFYFLNQPLPAALVVAGIAWGTVSSPLARRLPELIYKSWLLKLGAHGVTFSHPRLVDNASTVTAAVFCARGTLLHGEPDVSEIHPLRGIEEAEVLALAAGAESVIRHPVAAAILRAAETRQVAFDTSRSHHSAPGLGVLCVSQAGDQIVLGSRELLLRERISIAMAEETLRQLESRGLTAVMLARNEHLIGVLALEDSLRAGAKASVQLLLDEGIEPIVLSGDSRATTEAVARALSMEHVRPEVSTSGRAKEIESLTQAGGILAVIGTTPRDDPALSAASVPLVLEGASVSWKVPGSSSERGAALCGPDVLPAAVALVATRRARATAIKVLVVSFLPGLLGALAMAAELAPLFLPPVLSALGLLAAGHVARKSEKESVRLLAR